VGAQAGRLVVQLALGADGVEVTGVVPSAWRRSLG
jgi:hypothetical protein